MQNLQHLFSIYSICCRSAGLLPGEMALAFGGLTRGRQGVRDTACTNRAGRNKRERNTSEEEFRSGGRERYLAESNCSTRFCRPLPNRSAKVPCCLFAGAKVQQKNEITKYFCYFFHFFIANARNHPLLTDNPVRVCSSYIDISDGCCRAGQCCTSTHRHAHSAGDPCNSWGLASPSWPNR